MWALKIIVNSAVQKGLPVAPLDEQLK